MLARNKKSRLLFLQVTVENRSRGPSETAIIWDYFGEALIWRIGYWDVAVFARLVLFVSARIRRGLVGSASEQLNK